MLKSLFITAFMFILLAPASVSATINLIDDTQELCGSEQVSQQFEECVEECEVYIDEGVCAPVEEVPEQPVETPVEEPKEEPTPQPQVLAVATPEEPAPVLAETGVESITFALTGLFIAGTALAASKSNSQ